MKRILVALVFFPVLLGCAVAKPLNESGGYEIFRYSYTLGGNEPILLEKVALHSNGLLTLYKVSGDQERIWLTIEEMRHLTEIIYDPGFREVLEKTQSGVSENPYVSFFIDPYKGGYAYSCLASELSPALQPKMVILESAFKKAFGRHYKTIASLNEK